MAGPHARTLLFDAGLPKFLWGEAILHAAWLRNRTKDRRPEVRALAQHIYEMRFPPRERFVYEEDWEDELDFLENAVDEDTSEELE